MGSWLCLGRDASRDDESVTSLLAAGRKLIEIFDGPQRLVIQESWLKAMLRDGKRADLELLDSTVICVLDTAAGEFWRAVQCVGEASEREAKFLPNEGEKLDLSKGNLKDLAMYCVQLQTVSAPEMHRLGLPDVADKQAAARSHLKDAFTSLCEEVAATRESLSSPYTSFKNIRAAVQEWNEDQIRRLLPNPDEEEAGMARTAIQDLIVGPGSECAYCHIVIM